MQQIYSKQIYMLWFCVRFTTYLMYKTNKVMIHYPFLRTTSTKNQIKINLILFIILRCVMSFRKQKFTEQKFTVSWFEYKLIHYMHSSKFQKYLSKIQIH